MALKIDASGKDSSFAKYGSIFGGISPGTIDFGFFILRIISSTAAASNSRISLSYVDGISSSSRFTNSFDILLKKSAKHSRVSISDFSGYNVKMSQGAGLFGHLRFFRALNEITCKPLTESLAHSLLKNSFSSTLMSAIISFLSLIYSSDFPFFLYFLFLLCIFFLSQF